MGNAQVRGACRKSQGSNVIFLHLPLYVYGKSGGFYRCSKQACEIYIENYQAMYNLPYTILRYGFSLRGRGPTGVMP